MGSGPKLNIESKVYFSKIGQEIIAILLLHFLVGIILPHIFPKSNIKNVLNIIFVSLLRIFKHIFDLLTYARGCDIIFIIRLSEVYI